MPIPTTPKTGETTRGNSETTRCGSAPADGDKNQPRGLRVSKKTTPAKNLLPSPLQSLTPHELFIFTGISLYLCEGFIEGKFKPNPRDRKKLSKASLLFYKWNDAEKRAFVVRRKYRTVRSFLSIEEKEDLFTDSASYEKKLDQYLLKYWDRVVVAIAGE